MSIVTDVKRKGVMSEIIRRLEKLDKNFRGVQSSVQINSWVLINDLYASAADVPNFDFTSIPATFKDLKILFDGRSDRAATSDAAKLSMNNDTGNNYVGLIQWGAGQTEQATAGAPTLFTFVPAASSPASWFNNSEITLFDYANTNKFHGWQARGMQTLTNSAGNYFIYDAMGLYLSATVVSRVTLYPNLGTNFKRYSRATLFGLM